MSQNTAHLFDQVTQSCQDLFRKKSHDYGTAWRVLRLPSLTDQIFIKAQRIRTLQDKGEQKIADDIRTEFVGILNYSLLALVQLELQAEDNQNWQLEPEEAVNRYNRQLSITKQLMLDKNHDYGEAWRDMRVGSFVDLILMKLLRIKQIEDNAGKTLVSEGVDANYRDMINYSVFALIKLDGLA